jgi:hypothetical protein
VLELLVADEPPVDALERDRVVGRDRRHGIRRIPDARIPDDDQRARTDDRNELELGAQHRDQRRLAADQQTGQVEAVLRQQRVEVVTGDAARDVGKRSRISSP